MDTLTYNELLNEIDKIPVFESRIDRPDFKEFVVRADYVTPLHLIFQNFFGIDFKAPGENPSLKDKRHAAFLGGVREEQTLYYSEKEGFSNCAMMGPWNDGSRYTIKIAKIPN